MIPGIMDPTLAPFDRHRLRQHRDRAASQFQQHDFLFKDVAERLAERLADFARRFETALDLGCHGGELGRALMPIGKIDRLVQSDISASMARLAAPEGGPVLVADEEALPFAAQSFDLVMSNLSLHWVNDLPGSLLQIRHVLKPDGLFLAAMFVLGVEAALYSILTYMAAARTLDFVIHGIEEYTAMTIVSGESSAIREAIIGTLGRGVTVYKGYGGLTSAEQDVLYCVVTRLEIGKVKGIVRGFDPNAFIVSHALADVEGGVVTRSSIVHRQSSIGDRQESTSL